MTLKTIIVAWVLFALVSLLTITASKTLWPFHGYLTVLSALGALSVLSGIVVLWITGLRAWPTIVVLLALVVGQWWAIKMAFAMAAWSWWGFAP